MLLFRRACAVLVCVSLVATVLSGCAGPIRVMAQDNKEGGAEPVSKGQIDRRTIRSLRLGLSGGKPQKEIEAPDLLPLVKGEREENENIIGWLQIPGTKIDYPIVYDKDVPDYNFYTEHNAKGEPDPNGTYFADYRAEFGEGEREDLALLTTLYGHSFDDDPDGELMSSLKRYRDEDFARENPYLYFSTWKENMVFEIVAVFDAHVDLPYIRYDLQAMEFSEMLENVFESSLYDYSAEIKFSDKLLVVSCCTMNVPGKSDLEPLGTDYRFAVMGRLVPEGEALKRQAELTRNSALKTPDEVLVEDEKDESEKSEDEKENITE